MSIAESVKAKLRNYAIKEGRTFQEILTVYGLERFLYRLSLSPYSDRFVLKGGVLLYAMFKGDFTRGTTDVDLLGIQMPDDPDPMRIIFTDIFSINDQEDGLVFDFSTLAISSISKFKQPSGINVTIEAYLDRTKLNLNIDIGFGDAVFPSPIDMEYPTLLNNHAPIIQAYSKESVIAEKFQAIVSLGRANSRMKDFYDIYALAKSFDFDGLILEKAIKMTFSNRKTIFSSIVAFETGFFQDSYRRKMWNSFLKSRKIPLELGFETVLVKLMNFLGPVVESIVNDLPYSRRWNHEKEEWAF